MLVSLGDVTFDQVLFGCWIVRKRKSPFWVMPGVFFDYHLRPIPIYPYQISVLIRGQASALTTQQICLICILYFYISEVRQIGHFQLMLIQGKTHAT
jgi:hypothetical protein